HNIEGVFEWVNGDPVTYTNWYPGQPNNYNGNQDYVELLNNGKWNDQYTSEKREFVMELPCQGGGGGVYVRQISGPSKGSLFDVGTTEVCYAAYDGSGNTDTCCFNVVVDGLTIKCPDDITVNCAYGYYGAEVHYDAPELHDCGSSCVNGNYIPGYVYMGEWNDHHYYCSDYTANWADAKAAAEAHGGYLAVINDQGENDYLASRLLAGTAWIGLTDQNYEGNFEWINGDPYNYFNWYPGQPNNYNGLQDHVEILYNGQWNDGNGYDHKEFIMELPCTRIKRIAGPPSGGWFDAGETTVTFVGYDGSGNTDTCSFTVTVNCSTDPDYCPSGGHNSYYTWIQKVSLGSIDNNSGNNGGYADFTNLSTTVEANYPYVIGLHPGTYATYTLYWKIWIDYSGDGDFNDQGELVGYASGSSAIYGQFTVPYYAVPGETRMRVQMAYGYYPYDPCSYFNYGEVEDYTIHIRNPYFNDPSGEVMADSRNGTLEPEDLEAIRLNPVPPAPDWDNTWTLLDEYAVQEAAIEEEVSKISDSDWLIYPNPAFDYIEVDLSAYQGQALRLRVNSQLGQSLMEQIISSDQEGAIRLDVSEWAAGVYWLTIQYADGQLEAKPFVVQR
ncbi:MAG: lectin-like protein, partial [Bacteroidota bacterium]